MGFERFEKDLNPPQLEAVRHVDGPLLVLAGAGSGKTRVITYRIAHLISEGGVPPGKILAVTFTNKAAGEMKHRVASLLSQLETTGDVWVSTFHSTCARILRSHAAMLGYPRDWLIYDEDDSRSLAKKVLFEMNIPDHELKPDELTAFVDRAKNRCLGPDETAQEDDSIEAEAYAEYQKRLKKAGAMDFGDLILNVVALWRSEARILDAWRARFAYVLVDEFQDTNRAQMEFLLLACGTHRNICVVGDDDQSIYRWRGAEVGNILSFERHFPGATIVRLEQNYRSTQAILDAAHAVVSQNEGRHEKRLWTDRKGGAPVAVFAAQDDRGEADYVAGTITGRRAGGRLSFDDFAVFVRTGFQTRVFEEKFRELRIPYELVGGVRFYERKEIKDVLAYLRLCVNPKSDVDFERVVNVPARGIGDTTVERLRAGAKNRGISTYEAAAAAGGKPAAFVALLGTLAGKAAGIKASALTREILSATGYKTMIENSKDPADEDRLDNIEELIVGMEEFEEDAAMAGGTIAAFLEKAALTASVDRYSGEGGKVTLMTLHSAKGLEFRRVFIAGCEEGLFPHARSLGDIEELEEERRLMYVGMTRAKETLVLTHARRRRWQGTYREQKPSRFLSEIPRRSAASPPLSAVSYQPLVLRHERDDGTHVEYTGDLRPTTYDPRQVFQSGVRSPESGAGRNPKSEIPNPKSPRRVRHEIFGVGEVREIDGEGEQMKLLVYFPRAGKKKVLARFVEWID
ncbi:MAG: UvrD-helicase domain-containing protein [Deltaproteobacteria bacterium]|nr:UvrD-helicase domain-containing protein [Deltaproteobacteria bacterium]